MTTKRIVCLANSRKLHGRCVAGKELHGDQPGVWIRPVSAREHEEVSEYERQYQDGSDPQVLDILRVPLLSPRSKVYQRENWLLDPTRYWLQDGRADWELLRRLVDRPGPLWINGHHTYHGYNDKIPLLEAGSLVSSLSLIRVPWLKLRIFAPSEAFGNTKRRVQGCFDHHGESYRLWVTDPVYEKRYLARANDTYELGDNFLTVSLGEAYNSACYKLIAAIIGRENGSRE